MHQCLAKPKFYGDLVYKFQKDMGSTIFLISLEIYTLATNLNVMRQFTCFLFREHISKKSSIANRNLGLIFKSFTCLNKQKFMCLYKALVRPHLEYATQVWAPMYKKDSVTLENTQRRATRIVNSLKGLSYEERLKRLGLPVYHP